jgi:hypothetical protein
MWSRIFAGTLMSAACAAGAATMSATHENGPPSCRVVGAEKLPKDSGGAASICSAIERAIAAAAPKVRYTAEVRVISRSALAVNVEVDGRKLAEQHFAVMDRNLNPGSIKRFAEAVGAEVAKAAEG